VTHGSNRTTVLDGLQQGQAPTCRQTGRSVILDHSEDPPLQVKASNTHTVAGGVLAVTHLLRDYT
jgi:hypothetical protein